MTGRNTRSPGSLARLCKMQQWSPRRAAGRNTCSSGSLARRGVEDQNSLAGIVGETGVLNRYIERLVGGWSQNLLTGIIGETTCSSGRVARRRMAHALALEIYSSRVESDDETSLESGWDLLIGIAARRRDGDEGKYGDLLVGKIGETTGSCTGRDPSWSQHLLVGKSARHERRCSRPQFISRHNTCSSGKTARRSRTLHLVSVGAITTLARRENGKRRDRVELATKCKKIHGERRSGHNTCSPGKSARPLKHLGELP
jgi:hypothetical protein